MRESIKETEREHGKQLSVGQRQLVAVLDMAVNDIDREEILKQSDEQLAIHVGVSERSAARLKRILRESEQYT